MLLAPFAAGALAIAAGLTPGAMASQAVVPGASLEGLLRFTKGYKVLHKYTTRGYGAQMREELEGLSHLHRLNASVVANARRGVRAALSVETSDRAVALEVLKLVRTGVLVAGFTAVALLTREDTRQPEDEVDLDGDDASITG